MSMYNSDIRLNDFYANIHVYRAPAQLQAEQDNW